MEKKYSTLSYAWSVTANTVSSFFTAFVTWLARPVSHESNLQILPGLQERLTTCHSDPLHPTHNPPNPVRVADKRTNDPTVCRVSFFFLSCHVTALAGCVWSSTLFPSLDISLECLQASPPNLSPLLAPILQARHFCPPTCRLVTSKLCSRPLSCEGE